MVNRISFIVIVLFLFGCSEQTSQESEQETSSNLTETKADWAIVIHGGAGSFRKGKMSEEQQAVYEKSMLRALKIGETILAKGGSSLDAVEKTINALENDSLYNAGKGAVLTDIGTAELDASIMVGSNLDAGAVAGVQSVKNPISLARKVMENSPHVMLAGTGADQFAKENKLELVDNSYFITSRRKASYQKRKQRELQKNKMGTVGCVALDKSGTIVAGTSTGGTFLKKWGRVGDSPIIGAGTYANNKTCGVSATGWGEYFIRGNVAATISHLMEYKGFSLQQATDEVIYKQLPNIDLEKAKGGVIALDYNGNIATAYNTFGMLYAFNSSKGQPKFGLFKK